MTRQHHSSMSLYSIEAGMGENYLALEGLELNIPVRIESREDSLATLWDDYDDYFEEDIAALIDHSVAQQ